MNTTAPPGRVCKLRLRTFPEPKSILAYSE
jgi:hypothetical protein